MASSKPYRSTCARHSPTDKEKLLIEGKSRILMAFALAWVTADCSLADCPSEQGDESVIESEYLRLVTLNVAHGRKDQRNQILLKGETIRTNLEEVALALKKADAHLIALQEADAESAWSGRFNHVELLAEKADYPCVFHGIHASNRVYDFGTAILSGYPFQGTFSYSFKPSKPTTTKGFVAGALKWNPGGALAEAVEVKFVSVHLDFSRRSVRRSQIDEMVAVLSKIEGPMVVLGDFNTDWQTEDSSLVYLAEQLQLTVFEPHAEGLSTYGDKGARLDWILISTGLRFSRYVVVPEAISDHYAVAAEIVLDD
jgi:endonuclease/exonuclease/phosphatase family metal-dependent hydrolase